MKDSRPKLVPITEEMKEYAAHLSEEVRTWPQVNLRPMFGFFGVYRKEKIFGVIPKTRTMAEGNAIWYKVWPVKTTRPKPGSKHARSTARREEMEDMTVTGPNWKSFPVDSPAHLHGALEVLARAYESAK
jgi:hypothetical protein